MKRKMISEITDCRQCHHCLCLDMFGSHTYQCDITRNVSNSVYDHESHDELDKIMTDWFENCPKWRKI